MGLAIGIASGHRFTDAVAVDDDEIVAFARLEDSLNFHNEVEHEIRPRLRKLLAQLAKNVPNGAPRLVDGPNRLVLSLPGVSTPLDREKGLSWFRALGWDEGKVQVVDDTWTGLVSGLLKPEGICAFAGSGASVFFAHEGFKLGKPWKLDGYGAIIGDRGSGFETALRLIKQLCRARDANLVHPLFARTCAMEPGLEGLEGEDRTQEWFDLHSKDVNSGEWRKRVAKLATVVTDAAGADPGEQIAIELVKRAAGEIAETIMIGLRRFGSAVKRFEITCHGGMFRNSMLYLDEVKTIVAKNFPNRVRLGAYHPVIGATLMARAVLDIPIPVRSPEAPERILPDEAVTRRILESVFKQHPVDVIPKLALRATQDDLYGETTSDS